MEYKLVECTEKRMDGGRHGDAGKWGLMRLNDGDMSIKCTELKSFTMILTFSDQVIICRSPEIDSCSLKILIYKSDAILPH